jgi:hypothetical protein
MCITFSTDMISLRETQLPGRASISVEPCITRKTVARRAFIKNDNLKGTLKNEKRRFFEKKMKNSCPVSEKVINLQQKYRYP